MKKISGNMIIVQLLERNFGKMTFLKMRDYPSFIEGYYKGVLFQVSYKKNESLIFTVSDKGEWLLNEFGKVLKIEAKQEHICTYELYINNPEIKNLKKLVMEWNMVKPEIRINDLKNGRIYLNSAEVRNLKENPNRKSKVNQLPSLFR